MSGALDRLTPKVSVVVASVVGPPFVDDCIASLAQQEDEPDFEVLVVDCHGEGTRNRLQQKYPFVKIFPQDSRKTIPELRRIGVENARGDFVAIIEEHCTAAKNWVNTIANSFDPQVAAIGGTVQDDNYVRLRDWVTYFVEYNAYMPPMPQGNVYDLPGNNVAFRKEILLKHLSQLKEGYWEAFLYSRLAEEGAILKSVPAMVVYHRGPFPYGYYLGQRYLFSRAYAGARRKVMPPGKRFIYTLVSPALPALLLARISARVLQKKHRVGKYVRTFPLLIPAAVVYIAGELMGYLFGPGDALMKVE
ncbi:glycosyltransferase [bacterium]|nr:glycosyltransferase [bacterium]MCI0607067.1 glycosyltransferase [bacterium]